MAPLTPSELSDIEDVSRPTITRVVNNLFEAGGLIRRDPDPRDGRSWLISPTEAGDSYLAERRSRKSAYIADAGHPEAGRGRKYPGRQGYSTPPSGTGTAGRVNMKGRLPGT